jgi:hypothetical protein
MKLHGLKVSGPGLIYWPGVPHSLQHLVGGGGWNLGFKTFCLVSVWVIYFYLPIPLEDLK